MADETVRTCLFCERRESSSVQMFSRNDKPLACICDSCVVSFAQLYVTLIQGKVDDQELKKRMKLILVFRRRLGGTPSWLLEFCAKALVEAHAIVATKDDEVGSIRMKLCAPTG